MKNLVIIRTATQMFRRVVGDTTTWTLPYDPATKLERADCRTFKFKGNTHEGINILE